MTSKERKELTSILGLCPDASPKRIIEQIKENTHDLIIGDRLKKACAAYGISSLGSPSHMQYHMKKFADNKSWVDAALLPKEAFTTQEALIKRVDHLTRCETALSLIKKCKSKDVIDGIINLAVGSASNDKA